MKKLFTLFKASTLLLSLLLSSGIQAQDKMACRTNLNTFTGFTPLTSGTSVTDIETSCGVKSGIPLGFTFKFDPCGANLSYTTVQVSSKGWLKFGTPLSNCRLEAGTVEVFPGLWPLYGKSINGTDGTATYATETLPNGNKVFTMEWKNWRWDSLATPTTVYKGISFQVKLYEGSNLIEYYYRDELSSTPASVNFQQYLIGLGMTKPPTSAVASPCGPGYDYAIMADPITTPVLLKNGAYGENQKVLPTSGQALQFYQTCCGKPEAGVISQPDSVCACIPFTAKVGGATPSPFVAYGITYRWQTSPDGTPLSWVDVGPASSTATSQFFPGICGSADTFVRVIVQCTASGMEDTTPSKRIVLIKLPYNCYCPSAATKDDRLNMVNIGNVKLITSGNDTLIDNPKAGGVPAFINRQAFRPYSLYTGLRPINEINRDSSYKFSVMGITKDTFAFSTSGVALYIDYDNDGNYNSSTELAAFNIISGTTTNFVTSFTVPSAATLGMVGMRVVMKKGATSASDVPACGNYDEGETEDYLISITNPTCPGPLVAGMAYISDTSICDGYTTMIWDTAHAKNMSQMHWEWEYSLDNIIWANVPGSKFKDTIEPVVRQSTYYRLRIVCDATKDTIYSNRVSIKLKQPYKCYCYSLANGRSDDSSDISTVKLNKFVINTGGPHLNNPESVRMRTDYTDLPAIELWTETTYPIAVYHTMRTRNHADARISVFMDFNHNLKYDGASELIWSKVTSAADFYPHDNITIPAAVIPNVETGMRVVLNNDLGGNNPSDAGCDEFVSGEIEDFLVIFRRKTTGISELSNIDNLQIYPNPNNGQFTLSFTAAQSIAEAVVTVTNITGQQVYTEKYTGISQSFVRNINLAGQAPGVYFITLVADGQKSINKLIIR